MFTNTKALSIPEGEVIKIECGDAVLWEKEILPSYKNWVKYSTELDGTTIYNGGLGYKDGIRLRSGGAEGVQPESSCTGYIPVKGEDTVRMSGYNALQGGATYNGINVYDSSFTNLGQAVVNYADSGYGIFASTYSSYGWSSVVEDPSGVYVWTVPPDASIAYMRVMGYTVGDGKTGADMIVTVNEEITE